MVLSQIADYQQPSNLPSISLALPQYEMKIIRGGCAELDVTVNRQA
jgi:hypothetical protein